MENIGASLVAIVALLAANAFFVAAEFALVKVRGFQLDQAVTVRPRSAAMSLKLHGNMDAYLAACQLGITMASLGLGWVGEPAVAALLEPLLSQAGISGAALHTIAFLVGFLVFSSLHIVIGEQVPKTYAIRKPVPVTLSLAYPLHAFYLLVFPLNWLLDRTNAAILRLLGVGGGSHHEVISEDEISAIVDKSEAHGEIEEKTAELIQKAFRFDDEVARNVMVPWGKVDKLRLNDSPEKIRSKVAKTLHSRYPVVDDNDDVIGILAVKDLTSKILGNEEFAWNQMTRTLRPVLVVPESLLISRLLERMRVTRTHLAVLSNEYGTYQGIVTLEDLLEEIVGEIDDEWDTGEKEAMIQAIGASWRASGQLQLTALTEYTGIVLEHSRSVSTLGGAIMERLGRLPREGDQVTEDVLRYTVTSMEGRRIQWVSIDRIEKKRRKKDQGPENPESSS